MLWTTLILAGLVTFFTRFSMIALLKKDYFSPRVKLVLSYVPILHNSFVNLGDIQTCSKVYFYFF